MYESGKITNVWLTDVGSELIVDEAAGTSILDVDDALDFNAAGGSLRIISDSVSVDTTYISVDFENHLITLAIPTSSAFPSGTKVLVLPAGQQLKAMVDLDDGDEGITALIPSGMDVTMETGIREESEQEAVLISDDSGRWVVDNIDDERGEVDGDNIVNLPPDPESVHDYVVEYAVGPNEVDVPVSGWSTATPTRTPGTYIWFRTIVTYGNGTTSMTSPALLTGNDGAQGSQGIPGTPGADGSPRYMWLKYADSPTTGMSDSPTGKTYMGVAYNKTTPTESSTYSDYEWSLIQGPQGNQGIPGTPGADGSPTYTWVKYATNATGTAGFSDSPTGATYIGLAFNKTTATESSTPGDYAWSLIQGPQGTPGTPGSPGVSVTAITPYFARVLQSAAVPTQPTNQATPPAPWQLTEPAWVINTFLYRTEKISYSNGTYGYTTVVKVSADAAVGPSAVPSVSPAVRVSGTTSSLIAETDEVAAGTMIEYHISTTDGFTPTLGGPTKFTETEATVALIDRMPDGSALDPAGQYYVRTFAYNVKGPAPTYSAQTSARLNMSNVDALVTAKLIASFIQAGKISVGQFTLDAVGMRVNRPGGGYVFNFPFNGIDNLELTAAVTAVSLNIMNNLTINGSGNLNGILTAANGIVAPTSQPGVSRTWPFITTALGTGVDDLTEYHHGLIQHPGNTTQVMTALNFVGTTTVRSFAKSNGAWTGDLTLVGSWKNTFAPLGGLTYVGGNYFIMGTDSNRAGKWYIYKVDPAGNKINEVEVASDWTFFEGAYPRLFTDGTSVFYAFVNSSKNLRVVGWSQALVATNSANIMTGLSSRYHVGDVHMGTHDGVANRVWIAFRNGQEVLCFNPVTTGTPSTWTRDATYDFQRPSSVAGFTYDTTAGQMLTFDTTGLLYRHGKYPTNKAVQAKYAWYDANATGGTHETQPGPVRAYTLPARSYLSLQAEPPPDLNNEDPLNTDKANQVTMYATDDGGTIWRRLIYTADPWGADYSTLSGLASGTPKVTNEFLTSTVATPGRMKSFMTDTLTGVTAPAWEFDGSGKGKMGAYTTGRHYGSRTRTSNLTVANNTATNMQCGATRETTVGLSYDSVNDRFVIAKAGLYLVEAAIPWVSNAAGRREIRFRKNGTVYATAAMVPGGTGTPTQVALAMIPCAVGDTIDALVYQNSGSSMSITVPNSEFYFSCGFMAP